VAQGVWRTEVLQRGPGAETLESGSGGEDAQKAHSILRTFGCQTMHNFVYLSKLHEPLVNNLYLVRPFYWKRPARGTGTVPIASAHVPSGRQCRPAVKDLRRFIAGRMHKRAHIDPFPALPFLSCLYK